MPKSRKLLNLILSVLVTLSLFGTYCEPVYASGKLADVYSGNTTYECYSVSDINKRIENLSGNIVVEMKQSIVGGGRIVIAKNKKVTINMNGYDINRNLSDYKSDGECIIVKDGANLTINGSPLDENGKATDTVSTKNGIRGYDAENGHTSTFSVQAPGIITGGYSSNGGGGIHVKSDATVTLNYVWVMGNRAEQNWWTDGYGGGICVYGDNSHIILNNSSVIYNYAYNDGGGIYITNDDECTIELNNSHVDYNIAKDEGGGIQIDDEDYKITATGNSTISYNHCYDGNGGGIDLWNDDGSITAVRTIGENGEVIEGLTIQGNIASNNGGGVYVQEENIILSGLIIKDNKAKKGAGVFLENDRNTLSGCTITGNNATSMGGGVFYASDVDYITLDGCMIIRDNMVNGNTTDYRANLYRETPADSYGTFSLSTDTDYSPSIQPDIHLGMKPKSGNSNSYKITDSACKIYKYGWVTVDTENHASWYVKWNELSDGYLYITQKESEAVQQVNTVIVSVSGEPSVERDMTYSVESDGANTTTAGEYSIISGYVADGACSSDNSSGIFKYFYSDGYFEDDAHNYNTHLATFATCFVTAAAGDYKTGDYNEATDALYKHYPIRKMLADIGCADDDIYVNDFNIEIPTTESIGVAIGSKELKKSDGTDTGDVLIAIGIRGANYKKEWASNAMVGESGESAGFAAAADIVLSEVQNYIVYHNLADKINSGHVKFFVSGFSRAGATANLAGKRLIDAYQARGNVVYGYAVEAPSGGVETAKIAGNDYNTLHCLVNTADLVPYVVPKSMGFIRYGVEHYLPGTEASKLQDGYNGNLSDNQYIITKTSDYKTIYAKMKKNLDAIYPDNTYTSFFRLYELHYAELSVWTGRSGSFLEMGFSATGSTSVTQESYLGILVGKLLEWCNTNHKDYATKQITINGKAYDTIEQSFADLLEIMNGENGEKFVEKLTSDYYTAVMKKISKLAIWDDLVGDWTSLDEDVKESYINDLMDALKSIGAYDLLSDEEKMKLDRAFPTVLDTLLRFLGEDYKTSASDYASSWGTSEKQVLVGTLAQNMSNIFKAHYRETSIAWARAYDSYYDREYDSSANAYYTYKIDNSVSPTAPSASVEDESEVKSTMFGRTDSSLVASTDNNTVINTIKTDSKIKLTTEYSGDSLYYEIIEDGKSLGTNLYRTPFTLPDGGVSDKTYQIKTTSYINRKLTSTIYNVTARDVDTMVKFDDGLGEVQTIYSNYGTKVELTASDGTDSTQYISSWKSEKCYGDGTVTDITNQIKEVPDLTKFVFTVPEPAENEDDFYLKVTVERKSRVSEAKVIVTAPTVGNELNTSASISYTINDQTCTTDSLPVTWYLRFNSATAGENYVEVPASSDVIKDQCYVAVVHIDNIDCSPYFSPSLTVASDTYSDVSFKLNNDRSADIKVVCGTAADKPESYTYSDITINQYNVNTNASLGTLVVKAENGKSATITAPTEVENAALDEMYFDHWLLADGSTSASDTVTISNVSADTTISISAYYKPVVKSVEVKLVAPEYGKVLAVHPTEVKVTIGGNTYYADPSTVNVVWKNEPADGIAANNTKYIADIRMYDDTVKFYTNVSLTTEAGFLKYKLDSQVAEVNGDHANTLISRGSISGRLLVSVEYAGFAKTVKPDSKLVAVGTLANETVEYGTTIETMVSKLNSTVSISVDDSRINKASISWNETPETNGSVVRFAGTVQLPSDISNPYNVKLAVTKTFIVKNQEMAIAPVASVDSRKVSKAFTLILSGAEEDAEIYYSINSGEEIQYTEGTEISISPANANKYGRVILRAIAKADNKQDGYNVYIYNFKDAISDTPYVIYNNNDDSTSGTKQTAKKTSKTDETVVDTKETIEDVVEEPEEVEQEDTSVIEEQPVEEEKDSSLYLVLTIGAAVMTIAGIVLLLVNRKHRKGKK